MINLLPPDLKQSYVYARRNHRLAHWVTGFWAAIGGLLIITLFGLIYINRSITTYSDQVTTTNKQLQVQNLDGVQKQVAAISNNLKLTVQVLSREVLFSNLLDRLGSVTPPNVILTNLAIQQTTGGIDIVAETADYNAATQLQVNLADPANQIFAKADIVSIACTTNTTNPKYPCTVNLRALFSANNPFLFINSGKKAGS